MRKQRQQIRNNSERIPSIHSSAFPAAAFAAPTFAAASTVFAAEFADGQKKYQTAYMSTNMPANMTILYLKRYGKRHRTQKRHANDALSRQPLCQAHHWQAFARNAHTDAEACQ